MSTRKTEENSGKKVAKLTRKIKLIEGKLEAQKSELHARLDGQEVWIRNCPPQNSNLFKMMCKVRELEEGVKEQDKVVHFLMGEILALREEKRKKTK